jgi:hypothetical protein
MKSYLSDNLINIRLYINMIGRVYKITNKDESIVYVGSTVLKLEERWNIHKNHYQRWLNGEPRSCSIYQYFRDNGVDTFRIYLVSECSIESHSQLRQLEQKVIEENNCINKIKAFRSDKQLAAYQLDYQEKHKDQRQNYMKDYRETNRERVREQAYALASQRVDCVCGLTYTRYHKDRHQKSKRHHQLMTQKQS